MSAERKPKRIALAYAHKLGAASKTLPALLFLLLPAICYADVGDVGRVAMFAIGIFLVMWGGLSIGVFLANRRQVSARKRFGLACLFFVSPAVCLMLVLGEEYAFGDSYTQVTETTGRPLVVAGITFPAGSRAHYEQKGGFFGWHAQRTLLDIHSPHAISLGDVHIDGLKLDPFSEDVTLDLSGDQTIEGWPCAASFGPIMSHAPSGFVLKSCWLTAPREWRGQLIPAGTNVTRSGTDWIFAQ